MNITPIQQEIIKSIHQAPLGILPIQGMTTKELLAVDLLDAARLVFKQVIMTHYGLTSVVTLRRSGLDAYLDMEG